MELSVYPGNPLNGRVMLPGDKSLSHRAALLAALAEGESHIENFLVAGVTQAMLEALSVLGVDWKLEADRLTVEGCGLSGLRTPEAALDCGNSATTMRLLAGATAGAGIGAVLDGTPGLRRRPMNRIVIPLQQMGVPIRAGEGGTAPLRLEPRPLGQPLRALEYTLPVASAQVKTCLLLAALAADGPSTLTEPEISRDHTERMLASMGVEVRAEGPRVRLTPPGDGNLKPLDLALPGDISSAAFLIVAALISPGSEITIQNVLLNPTRTGLLDALEAMGATVHIHNGREQGGELVGDVTVRSSALRGTEIDGPLAVRMIDEFPAFAIAAAYASGRTIVRGAAELRHKESDRIAALSGELRGLGVHFEETPDGFSIRGGGVGGGRARPNGDHRLAMALAVCGLAAQAPVCVEEAEVITESFPGFTQILQALGGDLRETV